MDNKQLMERAAKAAGYKLFYWGDGTCMRMAEPYDAAWNPIESDADAFRLMVDCEILTNVEAMYSEAFTDPKKPIVRIYFDDHNNDKHAATRMAITKAAAQSQENT